MTTCDTGGSGISPSEISNISAASMPDPLTDSSNSDMANFNAPVTSLPPPKEFERKSNSRGSVVETSCLPFFSLDITPDSMTLFREEKATTWQLLRCALAAWTMASTTALDKVSRDEVIIDQDVSRQMIIGPPGADGIRSRRVWKLCTLGTSDQPECW